MCLILSSSPCVDNQLVDKSGQSSRLIPLDISNQSPSLLLLIFLFSPRKCQHKLFCSPFWCHRFHHQILQSSQNAIGPCSAMELPAAVLPETSQASCQRTIQSEKNI